MCRARLRWHGALRQGLTSRTSARYRSAGVSFAGSIQKRRRGRAAIKAADLLWRYAAHVERAGDFPARRGYEGARVLPRAEHRRPTRDWRSAGLSTPAPDWPWL